MPAKEARRPMRGQLVPLIAGASVAAVTFAGVLIFFNPLQHDSPTETAPLGDQGSSASGLIPTTSKSMGDESREESKTFEDIDSLFGLPTFLGTSIALDDVLARARLPDLFDLLDQAQRLQGVERRRSTQTQIFRRIAAIDPIQALQRAQSLPQSQHEHFAAVIYRDWSWSDLDSAVSFGEEYVPTLSGNGRTAILEAILRARTDLPPYEKQQIAERFDIDNWGLTSVLEEIEGDVPLDNPVEAWADVLSAGDDHADRLFEIALIVIDKEGYATFASLANAIQDRQSRTRLISRVLGSRLQTDKVSTVFEHAVQMFRETARPAVFQVMSWWTRVDAVSALKGASSVSVDELRKNLVEYVISEWSSSDPREMLENLDLLPDEVLRPALGDGIMWLSAHEPREVTKYLDKIPDPEQKWTIMWNMLQNWAHRDIREAFEWFLDESETEVPEKHSRASLLQSLLFRVTPETAPSLFEQALEYPVDKSGSGWEGSIVGAIARIDMAKARELLPQVRDGPGRIAAYASIGVAYFNQENDLSSALELATELPEDDQAEYFGELLPQLSARKAYELLPELPTDQARARVALRVLQRAARFGGNFTDEQIELLESFQSFLTEKERAELQHDPKGTLR